jgi:uncharacterized repeat protein (TIGR01451 family)/fimbrial isopeptide formation D2 family protein
MKKSFIILSALVAALVAPVLSGTASAAQITYVSVVGNWHDPVDNVPGSQPGDPVITNGSPTSIIRWGTTSGTPQSGYDYTATIPPPFTLPGPIPFFSLGTFTHRNFEVGDPSLTAVQLDVVLVLDVDGVQTGPLTFTYTFNHEETPNNQNPCPYPTPPGEGCTDRVTIVSSAQPTTFNVGGVDYTLSMSFLDANGNPVSEFITREGGTINSSGLVGQFTLPGVPPDTPVLIVRKSGPATMSPGQWGDFGIDVQGIGLVDAFNVTLVDRLPDGPAGGMCDNAPQVLSARVFAADGVTPVPGKGPLLQGTDYSLAYDGVACELTFNALTAATVIGPGERLLIAYRTQLDSGSQQGITLTNVVGATQWYDGDSSDPNRQSFTRTLTDGTVGTIDHEDAHTVAVNLAGYFFEKTVENLTSGANPATIVAPGDTLRYTLRVQTTTQAFDNVTVYDELDALNATPGFAPGTLTLVSYPAGVDTSATNPTGGASGTGLIDIRNLSVPAGSQAQIVFDVTLAAPLATGTIVANQASLRLGGTPFALSDDPNVNGQANPFVAGDEDPTRVQILDAQQLAITKQVAVVGGGAAVAGAVLEYLVTVTNIAQVPAFYVVITDDVYVPVPGLLTLDAASVTMNGSTNGITVNSSLITADYSTTYGPLQAGQTIVLQFRAQIVPGTPMGTTITNTGTVKWNNPPQTASASVSIDVGGIVGVGILNGTAWHDANFNKAVDIGERLLEGWAVELYRNDQLTQTVLTDATGVYRISGVEPNYATADRYELRFVAPGAGPNTAKLGRADSVFTNDLQRISDIVVQVNSNLQNLNLPIEPNGVVYNTITRTPVTGAVLRMLQAGSGTPLPSSCFYDPAQQSQITLASGYYRFDINFSDPACASGGSYVLDVSAPGGGYVAGYSQLIPPTSGPATAAFSVPACPGTANDAIPATAQRCEVQISEFAPPASVPLRSAGTAYHVHLTLDDSLVPGSSQIFNNHIPLDPDLDAALAISKTTPMVNVTRGQLVPYTITVRNTGELPLLQDVRVVDRFPAGFRYVEGSARIDGVPAEPAIVGRELTWNDFAIDRGQERTILLMLAVGAGVGEGEFVNRAQAIFDVTNVALSGEAMATVRVVPDPTFDCTDVTGKVFNDLNRDGLQQPGEAGLSGIRLVTARGLTATTDAYGRYHITCAITPVEGRGSNFVLKLDDRTLPSGYRPSTDQVRVQRATRGKTLRMNFGASIYRVVSMDLADAVFEPDSTEIRLQWQPRIELLLGELRKAPSLLRLSYLAEIEDPQLVERRLNAVKEQVLSGWKALDASYELKIEPEVFWRLGSPPKQRGERSGASR